MFSIVLDLDTIGNEVMSSRSIIIKEGCTLPRTGRRNYMIIKIENSLLNSVWKYNQI